MLVLLLDPFMSPKEIQRRRHHLILNFLPCVWNRSNTDISTKAIWYLLHERNVFWGVNVPITESYVANHFLYFYLGNVILILIMIIAQMFVPCEKNQILETLACCDLHLHISYFLKQFSVKSKL